MPEFDESIDDVDPPLTFTPLEGGDEATVAEKVVEEIDTTFEEYRAAAREVVDARRERVDPSEENLQADLDELREEFEEQLFEEVEPRTDYLQRRVEEYGEEIPDLTEGRLTSTGKRTLEWIDAADSEEERDARIQDVLETGDEDTLTALFHAKLPARAAGFRDATHRTQKLEEALQATAPEAYASYNAIREGLNNLENMKGRFIEQTRAVNRAALHEFRQMLAD